jgi:hypothetical protein
MTQVIFATRKSDDTKRRAFAIAVTLPAGWTPQTAEQIFSAFPDPYYRDLGRAGGAVSEDGARLWVAFAPPKDPDELFTGYRTGDVHGKRWAREQISAGRSGADYAIRLIGRSGTARDAARETVEYALLFGGDGDIRSFVGNCAYFEFCFAAKPSAAQVAACDAVMATAVREFKWPKHSAYSRPVILRQPDL